MEKNLVVVYDNGIGLPFVLKPVGNKTLLLSPGIELSRLRVDGHNWNLDEIEPVNSHDCCFRYLCMTGEEIPARQMFSLIMLNLVYGDENAIRDLIDTLDQWGITCPHTPVVFNIMLSKHEQDGKIEYCFSGDGFKFEIISSPEGIAKQIGFTLKTALGSDLFMELLITIDNYNLSDEEFKEISGTLKQYLAKQNDIYLQFNNNKD